MKKIIAAVLAFIIVLSGGCSTNKKAEENTENITKCNAFLAQPDVMKSTGADGTMLYYADENQIIFGGYFGLFVYDLQNDKMISSLNLETIGCDATQGDEYCEIKVAEDGEKVYLHPVVSSDMYVYETNTGTLEKTKYNLDGIPLFSGIKEDDTYCKLNNGNGTIYLTHTWGEIGQLGYIYYKNGTETEGFGRQIFISDPYHNLNILKKDEIHDIEKIEMMFHGQLYSCDSKKAVNWLKGHMKNAVKIESGTGCPFEDPMYLTKEDGTIGMIYPATDSCNVILTQDGYYEYKTSEVGELWQLLGWDPQELW